MTPTSIHRLINQHRAPRLWLLFQNLFGGNADKKRLVRWLCRTVGNVLEVGCSVGNIADAFRMTSTVQYVGLDIDDFSRARIQASVDELIEERDTVHGLGLLG